MAPTPRYCPAGCGQLVLRARTEALKWQLLNPDPDPAGNTAVRIDHQDNVFARGLRKGEQPADFEEIYMPHKATCQVEHQATQQRARQRSGSVTDLAGWKAAQSRQAARKRVLRGRGVRAAPPVAGVRWRPRPGRDSR